MSKFRFFFKFKGTLTNFYQAPLVQLLGINPGFLLSSPVLKYYSKILCTANLLQNMKFVAVRQDGLMKVASVALTVRFPIT
jgi:hypothetical protein